MKKTKLLSVALCIALVLSTFSLTAMAITFDDVENDPTVSWAKDSINKMADAGYIKGYEDGTFLPYKAISKIECLLLMARMIGFENKEFADVVDAAYAMHGGVAEKYNKTYEKEISYLLYCGVLKQTDLAEYASATQSNAQLLRAQAAVLMAKLIGADEEARTYTVATPTYADDASIPANTKPYVEYVTKENIMNGMDATEDGRPQFSPVTSLTRAQMATLLARLMDRVDIEYVTGTIEEVSSSGITVDGDDIKFISSTKVYFGEEAVSTSDLNEGDSVAIVKACGSAYAVMAEESEDKIVVYGVVDRKSDGPDGKKITVYDYEDKETNASYYLKNNCTVTVNGSKGTFADIMSDDFVKLELTGGKVSAISTEETKLDISGKIVSVEFDDDDHVYLNIGDKNGENVQNYVVSSKGSVVSRDGNDAEFRDLSAGDSVTVRLTYGKITRVTATSSSEKFSGLLTEIIISSNPAITVTSNGEEKTYKLRSDVNITIAGESSDIYDLRPNITVSGTLDSSEVKTLTTSTVSVDETGELEGTVTGKNTTYSVFTIEDEDGNSRSVYYNSKTNFLTRTGASSTAKSVQEGAKVSVVGAEKNGVFEATIIILK